MPVVDVPAFINDAPDSPGFDVNDISTTDTSTFVTVNTFSSALTIDTYGVGSSNFNWTPPAGAVVTSIAYVMIASAPSQHTITADTSGWGYTPAPTSAPFVYLDSSTDSVDPCFPTLPVGFSEVVSPFVESYSRLTSTDHPYNRLWASSDTGSYVIDVAYLAIRITYDAGLTKSAALNPSRARFSE